MMRPLLIRLGDRVTMSNVGRHRHPGYADLEGTIVGRSAYPSSVRVKFDCRKQVETFHRDYLELVLRDVGDQEADRACVLRQAASGGAARTRKAAVLPAIKSRA